MPSVTLNYDRTGLIMVLTAALLIASPVIQPLNAQQAPAPLAKPSEQALHGRKLVEAYCAVCHGVDGNTTSDPLYPKLAGQKAYYLRQQMRAFKNGARKSDLMAGPASSITDAQIRELARYFSRQRVKPDPVKDPELAAIGVRIFRYSSRRAPACAACHGGGGVGPGRRMGGGMMAGHGMGGMRGGGHMGMMMGKTAAVPNLYGQHATYIVKQLDAFASGTRRGTVMGPIASAWREKERRAVAEYLSGQR
jgi:cytochrome c553